MKLTDQNRVVNALIFLRDKYRQHAIRCQQRAEKKVAAAPEGKAPNVAGFMAARDSYIYSAEALEALIPHEELPTVKLDWTPTEIESVQKLIEKAEEQA